MNDADSPGGFRARLSQGVLGGYNMTQVDEFLDVLTEDYSALYSENAVLKSKMKVLVEKVEELRLIKDRHPILGWPLIRGTVNFLSSMVNGVKALMYSADFYPEEETTEPSKFEQWLDRTFSNKKLEGLIVGLSVLLGIGLSIFLFLVLPTFLTGGLLHFFPDFPMWGRNLIEAC